MGIIPRHQWTHDGARVHVLHCGTVGYGGFVWPTTVGATLRVAHPTRSPDCDAGGFYGWPWGFGLGDGKNPDWSATWIVYAAQPGDVIAINDKVKCCGDVEILFVGDWASALAFVLPGHIAWVTAYACGAASATGARGAAVVTGLHGRARGGPYGMVALAWDHVGAGRVEMRCAQIGCGDGTDGHLKAETWYVLDRQGVFIEEAHE